MKSFPGYVSTLWKRSLRLLKAAAYLPKTADTNLLLTGRNACWNVARLERIDSLRDVEFRVFSQWGEDGIIEWLIQALGVENETFIEFGVEDYREANTAFLLRNRNWRGLVIDADENHIASIRAQTWFWKHELHPVAAFVTRENVNELFVSNGFGGDIGLLSIDIDGNDYWILEAIESVSADILVCEYNPLFGDRYAITVPYREDFSRLRAHPSGVYFGASITAIRAAASRKGYEFVGTCSNGVNAFFVRRSRYDALRPKIARHVAHGKRYRDARTPSGDLDPARANDQLAGIAHLPVVVLDPDAGMQTIASLGDLYSGDWRP